MAEDYRAALQAAVNTAETATSLSDRVAAALAGSFYKDAATGQTIVLYGPGWGELMRVRSLGGYDGVALLHAASRTLVIINRGTEGLKSYADWRQNVGAVLFDDPGRQLVSAIDLLVDAYAEATPAAVDQVLICGHSLGGALADAQAALAASVFVRRGLPLVPVRAVGVASGGMARAAERFAAARGLSIAAHPEGFITHYIRAEDRVPHHPRRSVFGRDQLVASIYHCRHAQAPGPHGGPWEWQVRTDELAQHSAALYHAFFDQPGSRHIWYSQNQDRYFDRAGVRPPWRRNSQRPADW
jgi:hypothetical protein